MVYILIFVEKVIIANIEADNTPHNRKQKHFFGVAVQKIWDTLPTRKIDAEALHSVMQEFHKYASQNVEVCVRGLLNTSLVLLDYLRRLAPDHKNNIADAESRVVQILQGYDPDISDKDSQDLGEQIGKLMIEYLEKVCTLP